MKKLMTNILALCLMFSLCACGRNNNASDKADDPAIPAEETSAQATSESIADSDTEAAESDKQPETDDVPESDESTASESAASAAEETDHSTDEKTENIGMQLTIGDKKVTVEWEDNASVNALMELCSEEPLTIQMSMYGGFEQVGSIGTSLPRDDMQTTTNAGDIVLYSGNQIVVFYGSNSWAYTRLGKITGLSAGELKELLGNGDVTITIGK